MDPNQQDLFDVIWKMVETKQYPKLALYLTIIWAPAIWAWVMEWRKGRAEKRLYEARISDKDAEIKRLAAVVKDFQNKVLKTKRP